MIEGEMIDDQLQISCLNKFAAQSQPGARANHQQTMRTSNEYGMQIVGIGLRNVV